MKLVTFRKQGVLSAKATAGGQTGVLLNTGEILDLSSAPDAPPLGQSIFRSLHGILEAGDEGLKIVRKLVSHVEESTDSELDGLRERKVLLSFAGTQLLAPLPRPALIISGGRCWASHQKEMKGEGAVVQTRQDPSGFIKSTTTVIGHGAPIVLPPQFPDMVDFEGEFCVVFGRVCHNVGVEEAMNYVAGYTIINDISARNWVDATKAKGPSEAVDAWRLNLMGKQLPTFCPMGPVLITSDEIADPHSLNLTTTLNGVVMQSANTRDLLFGLNEMIAYYSKWYRFEPGDLVSTGTPSGVGFARSPKVFMKSGDIVSVQVDGVGTLTNPVVAD
jgi:acylpyruvate hydrolase